MEGGSGEPYLADIMPVPAALIQGILGVRGTWEELDVEPSLPAGWRRASASVVYRGKDYCVSIRGERVSRAPGRCRSQPVVDSPAPSSYHE
jgi:cellobiose phosphorylase